MRTDYHLKNYELFKTCPASILLTRNTPGFNECNLGEDYIRTSVESISYVDVKYDAEKEYYANKVRSAIRKKISELNLYSLNTNACVLDKHFVQELNLTFYSEVDYLAKMEDRSKALFVLINSSFNAVSAYENAMLAFAAYNIDSESSLYLLNKKVDIAEKTHFMVVQPFAQNGDFVDEWIASKEDITRIVHEIVDTFKKADTDSPIFNPTELCKRCPARAFCPALARAADESGVMSTCELPSLLSENDIGDTIKELKTAQALIDTRICALEREAIERLKDGGRIKGYYLGISRGSSVWSDEDEALKLAKECGIDIIKGKSLMTPRQAVIAGLDEEKVKSLTKKTQGSEKLIEDKKENAKKIFG
jgi:hypothetical protein